MPSQRMGGGARPALRTVRDLARLVQGCTSCSLHTGRVRPVVGEGPEDARLVIVAAVPRRHEDLLGVALAGAGRNVLDHALTEAGLALADVRLTAIVRCRPPDDRPPARDEVDTCAAHLRAELELVAPEVVVALGTFATTVLLGRRVPLERVAGYRFDILQGITLIPSHDPRDAVRGLSQITHALRRDLTVAKGVLDGRVTTGSQAVAAVRSRAAAGG